jgi:hypothetical protein
LPWARFVEVIFKGDEPFRIPLPYSKGKTYAYRACYTFPIDALDVVLKKFFWRFLKQRSVPAVERARMRD